jgi:ubiquinone/menaquinone biosynthesis C-methylase UbiE
MTNSASIGILCTRMTVLDLGCGPGTPLTNTGASPSDRIVGVDLDFGRLKAAAVSFPDRKFVQAKGEVLPFRDRAFDRVVSQVALPYMNIPVALAETNRVLVSGGTVYFSLHAFRFTLHELGIAFPKPKALLFRLWVMLNGLILHFSGKPASIGNRYESFQTVRGISLALRKAGFEQISVSRPEGHLPRLVVQARKIK